jgi:hypothetical protein
MKPPKFEREIKWFIAGAVAVLVIVTGILVRSYLLPSQQPLQSQPQPPLQSPSPQLPLQPQHTDYFDETQVKNNEEAGEDIAEDTDFHGHGDLAIKYLQFMSENLYGRKPYSYREKETAFWLIKELLNLGLPAGNIYLQEFPLVGNFRWWALNNEARWASEFELRQAQLSQNIIVTIPGQSEREIIVGAHYDSHPTPGASDNASGVSLLLESAARMLQADNYYTIVYVFFGGHEAGGFVAADFFARSLTDEQSSNIVMMINADNLLDGPHMFYGAAYSDNLQPGANELTEKIDEIADKLDLGLIKHPPAAFMGSDHQAFLNRGHTVVCLTGLYRMEIPGYIGFFNMDGGEFTRGVSHTQNDDFHIINAKWPGMIQTNMRAFAIFLEELLLIR